MIELMQTLEKMLVMLSLSSGSKTDTCRWKALIDDGQRLLDEAAYRLMDGDDSSSPPEDVETVVVELAKNIVRNAVFVADRHTKINKRPAERKLEAHYRKQCSLTFRRLKPKRTCEKRTCETAARSEALRLDRLSGMLDQFLYDLVTELDSMIRMPAQVLDFLDQMFSEGVRRFCQPPNIYSLGAAGSGGSQQTEYGSFDEDQFVEECLCRVANSIPGDTCSGARGSCSSTPVHLPEAIMDMTFRGRLHGVNGYLLEFCDMIEQANRVFQCHFIFRNRKSFQRMVACRNLDSLPRLGSVLVVKMISETLQTILSCIESRHLTGCDLVTMSEIVGVHRCMCPSEFRMRKVPTLWQKSESNWFTSRCSRTSQSRQSSAKRQSARPDCHLDDLLSGSKYESSYDEMSRHSTHLQVAKREFLKRQISEFVEDVILEGTEDMDLDAQFESILARTQDLFDKAKHLKCGSDPCAERKSSGERKSAVEGRPSGSIQRRVSLLNGTHPQSSEVGIAAKSSTDLSRVRIAKHRGESNDGMSEEDLNERVIREHLIGSSANKKVSIDAVSSAHKNPSADRVNRKLSPTGGAKSSSRRSEVPNASSAPPVKPVFGDVPLQIAPALVHQDLSIISVKRDEDIGQSESVTKRNSFRSLHRPDVSSLKRFSSGDTGSSVHEIAANVYRKLSVQAEDRSSVLPETIVEEKTSKLEQENEFTIKSRDIHSPEVLRAMSLSHTEPDSSKRKSTEAVEAKKVSLSQTEPDPSKRKSTEVVEARKIDDSGLQEISTEFSNKFANFSYAEDTQNQTPEVTKIPGENTNQNRNLSISVAVHELSDPEDIPELVMKVSDFSNNDSDSTAEFFDSGTRSEKKVRVKKPILILRAKHK